MSFPYRVSFFSMCVAGTGSQADKNGLFRAGSR